MQVTLDFGYDQVFELAWQLSPEEQEKLVHEMDRRRSAPKMSVAVEEKMNLPETIVGLFQPPRPRVKKKLSKQEYANMLLDCPIMTDEEFEEFEQSRKELRNGFNRRLGFVGFD